MAKSQIYKCVLNRIVAPNPIQYTKMDKCVYIYIYMYHDLLTSIVGLGYRVVISTKSTPDDEALQREPFQLHGGLSWVIIHLHVYIYVYMGVSD